MTTSHTPTTYSTAPDRKDDRLLNTPEMIEQLAQDMRRMSGGELPHAFCIEQVKRQLAGKPAETAAANAVRTPDKSSVFHAWAMAE